MRMHRTSCVSSAISVCHKYQSFTKLLLFAVIVRRDRSWIICNWVAQGESSRQLKDCAFTRICSGNKFFYDLVDFSYIYSSTV